MSLMELIVLWEQTIKLEGIECHCDKLQECITGQIGPIQEGQQGRCMSIPSKGTTHGKVVHQEGAKHVLGIERGLRWLRQRV